MPAIRKSADLINNFNEIMEFCQNYREPVFITNNDQGQLAVMSKEMYEEITGIQRLYSLLAEGENDIKEGRILTEEEMDREIDLM